MWALLGVLNIIKYGFHTVLYKWIIFVFVGHFAAHASMPISLSIFFLFMVKLRQNDGSKTVNCLHLLNGQNLSQRDQLD